MTLTSRVIRGAANLCMSSCCVEREESPGFIRERSQWGCLAGGETPAWHAMGRRYRPWGTDTEGPDRAVPAGGWERIAEWPRCRQPANRPEAGRRRGRPLARQLRGEALLHCTRGLPRGGGTPHAQPRSSARAPSTTRSATAVGVALAAASACRTASFPRRSADVTLDWLTLSRVSWSRRARTET